MSSPSPASSIQDGGAATAPRVGDVRGMAEEAFDSGLHCAEAVASALARLQGIDAALVTRMASAFGSGMSLTRGPCAGPAARSPAPSSGSRSASGAAMHGSRWRSARRPRAIS